MIEIKPYKKTRTPKQNNCVHKYCEMLATNLNEAGFDQREVLEMFKKDFTVPWTKESIKLIYQLVAKAMYNKTHTSDLTTKEMIEVYKVVDQRISELTGVRAEWPQHEQKHTWEEFPR